MKDVKFNERLLLSIHDAEGVKVFILINTNLDITFKTL